MKLHFVVQLLVLFLGKILYFYYLQRRQRIHSLLYNKKKYFCFILFYSKKNDLSRFFRFFTAPFDVVKIRMQLQPHRTQFQLKHADPKAIKYARVIPALKTILREEGIRVKRILIVIEAIYLHAFCL